MKSDISIDLKQAQKIILDACSVLSGEEVSLSFSLDRFPARPLTALQPLPGYDQSLRDGYVIGYGAMGENAYRIIDEVAAGDIRQLQLGAGEAARIMTGGLIPRGGTAVVPKERCRVDGERLEIDSAFLLEGKNYIRLKGSELGEDDVIAPQGEPIGAEQQILLSGVGYDSVPVVRRPRVSFFCTGSELVAGGDDTPAGTKFSANGHLLHGLLHTAGVRLLKEGTVRDDPEAVRKMLTEAVSSEADIVISTGGMGPGKFDLVEDAFRRGGGEVFYRSLAMRPGKATLFGRLGKVLFFGMPGPPPAVHLLFNELVRPALLAFQGAKTCCPAEVMAQLTEDLFLPGRGLARLKSGCFSFVEGVCVVRPILRGEVSNCSIFCPAASEKLGRGETVSVHLAPSLSGFG